MRPSRILSLPLCLALLLASTVGLTGHDHGIAHERLAPDHGARVTDHCAIDHGRDPGPRGSANARGTRTVRTAGERHHHACVGCYLGGKRSAHAATVRATIAASVAPAPPAMAISRSRVARPWSSITLRGPPQA